ncbi:MAG: thiamine phosphate synthase [Bacteroidales bacterium]|nr:thiamine phosphate synthase [Bacteroidales bacterium]
MRRIGITPENMVFREQERITTWLRSGQAEFFHIRKPQMTEAQLREYLSAFPTDVRDRLTLHDFHHLAEELQLGGVHLNSRNPVLAEPLKGKRISASCHSLEEFAQKQTFYEYCFLSPVFDSVSKQGYTSAFSPEELKKAFAEGVLNEKAVALGGVTQEKIPVLAEIGFSACASVGEMWALPRTMFITHENSRYTYLASARLALDNGLRFVQLRMKEASDEEVLAVAEELRPLCDAKAALLTVDDRVHLLETGLFDGVHVGKNDLPVAEAKKITGNRFLLGATCNTSADALKAVADGADYLGVGPFRFTETKKKLAPILGLEGYARIMQALTQHGSGIPVYAIGGITTDDLIPLKQTGIHGVAISGALLHSNAVPQTSAELLKMFG